MNSETIEFAEFDDLRVIEMRFGVHSLIDESFGLVRSESLWGLSP